MAKFDRDGCRVPQTLFEAAAWHFTIVANCRRCRAQGVFEPAGMWWMFERKGWDTSFGSVSNRLKCKACGGRAALSSSRTAKPTIYFPPPSERDWKRVVTRFRS